jgi:catechol-2,3-dioxygenase
MRIHEVELLTGDLEAQRAFYTRVLGLTEAEHDATALALRIGASRLVFRAAPAGWRGIYHFAFNIPENRFGQAKAWLEERTPLRRDPDGRDHFNFPHWNADAVYFTDAAGNIGELIARHSLPNAVDHPFSSRDLLEISEIGLAADDVPAAVALLQEQLGVEVYSGQGSDSFSAVGDEEGLLIVVRRGRTWFTDPAMPAEPLQTWATLAAAGGRRTLVGPPWQAEARITPQE